MRTEDLIVDLAGRVTPVRPLARPGVRALGWLAMASLCGLLGLTFFGARADVIHRLAQPDYLLVATIALTMSILAVTTSLTLAIPGAERGSALRLAGAALLGAWVFTMVWAVIAAGHGLPIATDPHWPVCFARVLIVAAIPAWLLVVMVRRALPLRPGWTAAATAAAAASVGALVTQLACPLDDAGHGFLGHFVPVMMLMLVGVAAQRVLVRRR